jgi:23S rRNA (uracil1939-C5)-methyltransferase
MLESILEVGQETQLTIESINHQGQGVGRFNGMAVFVPFTIPGEQVLVKIVELKKRFAIGKLIKIETPSEKRVKPLCAAYETCGGSHFQHIDYPFQLELKRKLIEDSLNRIGKITDAVVHPALGMEKPWGYRNKAQFQVSLVDSKIKLGFFEEGSHNFVSAGHCLLMERQILDAAVEVEKMLNKYQLSVYNWITGKGLLRHVVIRKAGHPAKIMVILVTSREEFSEQSVLAHELIKLPHIISVIRNININKGRQVFGKLTKVLAGHGSIIDKLGGLKFSISPTSFSQVNSGQTEVLFQKVVKYAALTGSETVLDVYCGIGPISMLLAKKAARVIGIEVSTEAIHDARNNAVTNNITNIDFSVGLAEVKLSQLAEQGIKPGVIVVDPPRQGVEKRALQAIADMAPMRIVYISCDPGTMARDLNYLSSRGYKVIEVQPLDMFPQTSHVESVVLLCFA